MKKSKNILREIKSRRRKDKLQRFLKEYKNLIIALIGLLIIIVLAGTVVSIQKKRKNELYSQKFYKAISYLSNSDLENATKSLEDLYYDKKTPNAIRAMTGLRYAYLKLAIGQQEESIKIYKEVYTKTKDLFIKNLAGLSAVNLLINQNDEAKYPEIDKLLGQLINKKNPVINLAKEQKALFEIQKGNKKAGIKLFEEILEDQNLDETIRIRVENFLKIYE